MGKQEVIDYLIKKKSPATQKEMAEKLRIEGDKYTKMQFEELLSEFNIPQKDKEVTSFLGGYAEFWDNPEDNRWDKEEAQKQRLRWFKVGEIHQLNSFLMWLNWLIQTPKKDWEKEIKCKANQIFLNIKYEKDKKCMKCGKLCWGKLCRPCLKKNKYSGSIKWSKRRIV